MKTFTQEEVKKSVAYYKGEPECYFFNSSDNAEAFYVFDHGEEQAIKEANEFSKNEGEGKLYGKEHCEFLKDEKPKQSMAYVEWIYRKKP